MANKYLEKVASNLSQEYKELDRKHKLLVHGTSLVGAVVGANAGLHLRNELKLGKHRFPKSPAGAIGAALGAGAGGLLAMNTFRQKHSK